MANSTRKSRLSARKARHKLRPTIKSSSTTSTVATIGVVAAGARKRKDGIAAGVSARAELAKIIGTMLLAMGTIPLLFLLSPGDETEPTDRLDSEHKG
jgi:hypothetical protein